MQINKPLKQIQPDIDKPILLVQELHVNGKNVLSRVSPCLKAIASRNKFHHQETKCRKYLISRETNLQHFVHIIRDPPPACDEYRYP